MFDFLPALRSRDYPTEAKDQQPFVEKMIDVKVQAVLKNPVAVSIKIWTVKQRRMAKGSTDVMIPAVEVTFTENPETALTFRKGGAEVQRKGV